MLSIEQLRQDGEAFWSAVEYCDMRDIQGLPQERSLASIYEEYAYLADMPTAQELKRQYDAASGLEKKKLGWLVLFITERIGGRRTAPLVDEYRAAVTQARLHITRTGEELAFREGIGKMQRTKERAVRQEVQDEMERVIQTIAPYREKIFQAEEAVIQEVGFANYFDMYNQCKEVDLRGVVRMLTPFVERTDSLYRTCLDRYLQEQISVPLAQAQRHDLVHVLGGQQYQQGFPQEQVVPVTVKFLAGMGLDLYLGGRAKIDIAYRPNKTPRAFTCPVVIPDDITLVCTPQGGPNGFGAFLHEASHVLHRGHTAADQVFELKYFGDKTVTEGYSAFFEYQVMNPIWLQEFLGLGDTREVVRFLALRELHQIRRYAAKVKFEIELHATPGFAEKKDRYARYMQEATGVAYPPDNYVIDQDQGFYSASYARAWVFAAMLEHFFVEHYGPHWWRERAVGDQLRSLYALGQAKNGDELVQQLGFSKLDPTYLEQKLLKLLQEG